MIHRRQFNTLLGGAAAAWPVAARGQQGERMRRVGILAGADQAAMASDSTVPAFVQALQQLGWSEGRNLRIDRRWAAGNADIIRKHAEELLALAPDVILTAGAATMGPLLQATRTVPIVFTTVVDPTGAGYVESLARPGGNATGFMAREYSLSGKWLELLKELTPSVTRVAVLRDSTQGSGTSEFAVAERLGPRRITIVEADEGECRRQLTEIEAARGLAEP